MDKLRVAFFSCKEYEKIYFNEIEDPNIEIKYFATKLNLETAHLASGNDAVCIFVNDHANATVLKALSNIGIRLILLRCAGFNNVDIDEALKLDITVLRVPAYSPFAVAEHTMAILQMANRRLHKAYFRVKDNNFALTGLLGLDLHGKRAGIIGTGKIGRAMAKICNGYGMEVVAWDPHPDRILERTELLTYVSREELLRTSDLISLHVPLVMGDGGTYHLIDNNSINMMKNSAMLVNTSRGGLIDTEALINALKKQKFHAVALDVYEGEDDNIYTDFSDEAICNDITARLLSFPNVVVTSHQAFFTREALKKIAEVTLYNARNYHLGREFGNAEVK